MKTESIQTQRVNAALNRLAEEVDKCLVVCDRNESCIREIRVRKNRNSARRRIQIIYWK